MKILKLTVIIIVTILLQNTNAFSQGIAINDDGTDANSSAILDVKSNAGDKGFLLPRITETQKNAISSPATSLLIYQTDGSQGFYFYNGTAWEAIGTAMKTYSTVAETESKSGNDNELCYVEETETFYRFETLGSAYIDDNKYVLSTIDAGTTRWLGVAGQYNLGDMVLSQIVHLDATSGSATITDLNKIYYIQAASSTTTITIPDAVAANAGWFLRIYKASGDGTLNIQTVSGQNVDGDSPAQIFGVGRGFYIKSDNATEWLKIQDSRKYVPTVIEVSSDYDGDSQTWVYDFMNVDTDGGDITVTLPTNISGAFEGSSRMLFNTGSKSLFVDPNGNSIDGITEKRVIAPGGYIELQKINGLIKIVREKNLTLSKSVTEISNLECWLDASQLSGTDGSTLSSWTDLANGTVFSASSGEEPILKTDVQNGKNVVRFDGVNDVMSAGDVEVHDNTRGLTMIAVVKPTDTKRMAILSKYLTTGDNREFAFGNVDNFLFEDLTWSSNTGAVINMGVDNYQIVEYVWTPGKAFELYINGVLQSTANGEVVDVSDGIANLKLGCGDYTNVGFWEGDFAEIMVYSEAVSYTEREALRANLAIKWDIDEIIIANSGAKYWQRDGNTNTISPDVTDDNLDIGNGTFTGNVTVKDVLNAPAKSTAPLSPQAGTIYFDTTDSKLKVYTGSIWENLN